MSSTATREFLVRRLMDDSERMALAQAAVPIHVGCSSSSDEDQRSERSEQSERSESGSNSSIAGDKTSPRHADAPPLANSFLFQRPPLFPPSPLHYAATLASLAQHMSLMQPVAASSMPLLYPHLYQSLMTFPSLEQIRQAVQLPKTPSKNSMDESISTSTTEIDLSETRLMIADRLIHSNNSCNDRAAKANSDSKLQHSNPRKRLHASASVAKSENRFCKNLFNSFDGQQRAMKKRATRKLQFEDEKSSPVSGMYIKDIQEPQQQNNSVAMVSPTVIGGGAKIYTTANNGEVFFGGGGGDIDESLNLVEETEEARQKLAQIPNIIGDYVCQLCKVQFADAFKLAQHRCPRIGHIEYRCPECDKVFNCPANLASHRRWHKPRSDNAKNASQKIQTDESNNIESNEDRNRKHAKNIVLRNEAPLNLSTKSTNSVESTTAAQNALLRQIEMGDTIKKEKSILNQHHQQQDLVLSDAGDVSNQCETCGKRFSRHAYLRRHAISHTAFAAFVAAEETEACCNRCQFWFPNKILLEKHVRYAHQKSSELLQFQCKFCSLRFHTSPALTRHINKFHPSQQCRVLLLDVEPSGNCI